MDVQRNIKNMKKVKECAVLQCWLKDCLISNFFSFWSPLPTKVAKSLPWAEYLIFPPIAVNNLFKFSAQGSNLTPFIGNGTKFQIPSEIKPPLTKNLLAYDILRLHIYLGTYIYFPHRRYCIHMRDYDHIHQCTSKNKFPVWL